MTITTTTIKIVKPQWITVKRRQCICNKCKYSWIPKTNKIENPRQCPNCKRQDWNR